jgi:hypothetical protein
MSIIDDTHGLLKKLEMHTFFHFQGGDIDLASCFTWRTEGIVLM